MKRILKKTLAVLTASEKRLILPLFLMMLLGAGLESLGITAVIPLVSGIMAPEDGAAGDPGGLLATLFSGADRQKTITVLILLLIAVFLLKNLFLLLQSYAQHRATARVRRRIQNKLFRYYTSRPYPYFLTADSGEILRTVTVDSDYFASLLNHVLTFFTDLTVIVILMGVVIAIHPGIALLLSLVLAAEYVAVLRLIRPFLRRWGKRYREYLGRGNGVVIETLRGVKTVKITGRERFFEKRYEKEVEGLTKAKMVERAFQGASGRLIEACTVTAVLLYLLIRVHAGGELSSLIPVLSAFVIAAARVLPCVGGVSNAVSYAGYYEGSLDRVAEAMREMDAEPPEKDGAPVSFREEIAFEKIAFSYPERDGKVLDGLDLRIPRGGAVGITGVSGEGKTTLLDLLLGLLSPTDGRILIDGKQADTAGREWRKLFAVIPQQVFMMAGTIRDNVVFGADRGDREKLRRALRIARLEEFVDSLKDGPDTEVGEAGVQLSGGQIQRIGIARAVYSDAPVIVCDEATSALDGDTEASLLRAIALLRKEKTLIAVTHREAMLGICDEVFRLEGGKLVPAKKNAEE